MYADDGGSRSKPRVQKQLQVVNPSWLVGQLSVSRGHPLPAVAEAVAQTLSELLSHSKIER